MPRRIRLLAVSPLAFWLGGGVAVEATFWAFNAEGWSAALGIISIALAAAIVRVSPAIAKAISDITPPLIKAIGDWREMRNRTKVQVAVNTDDIATIKDRAAAIEEQNAILRDGINRALGHARDLQQINAGLGEAGLMNDGYLKDKATKEATP